MFYKKPLLVKNTSKVKLKVSNFAGGVNTEVDENSLPMKYAKLSYNYRLSNGALKTGCGFDQLKFLNSNTGDEEHSLEFLEAPAEINKVWLFPFYNNTTKEKEHLLLVSADNKMFFSHVISDHRFIYEINNPVTFTSVPNAIYYNLNGEDVMLITSATDGMLVFQPQKINPLLTDAPKITSMCRHYERIFAIEEGKRTKLVFSANLDPTNWNVDIDEAGYIDLADERGALEQVISFNDYVYIFKEYGICRLSAYGDQTEFSISNLYTTSGKIYGNSVCLCGDRIMFLSKDGIYAFNGYSTSKLSLKIESLFKNMDNENCASAYFNGKYYLALKLNFADDEKIGCENYDEGFTNNALLEIDLKSGDIEIVRGVDIKSLCAIEYERVSKLVAAFNGEHKNKLAELNLSGSVFGVPLKKNWLSSFTNLGYPNKTKKIKSVNLVAKTPCSLILKTDKEEKKYAVQGAGKTTNILTNLCGEMFQFKFESEDSEAEISNVEIEISISK